MANPSTKRTFGPVPLAASAANIYNNSSSLIYDILTHIHVVNTTSGPLTFSLFVSQVTGTETAGKEVFVSQTVPGNGTFDYYCKLKLLSTDFLVGHGSTSLTITGEGEQYVV